MSALILAKIETRLELKEKKKLTFNVGYNLI